MGTFERSRARAGVVLAVYGLQRAGRMMLQIGVLFSRRVSALMAKLVGVSPFEGMLGQPCEPGVAGC